MNNDGKQLSNTFSTGGGGPNFEAHVQASFVSLMLTVGRAPCLPSWPIVEIVLQGKFHGYRTDDLIVAVEDCRTGEQRRLLAQIKHSIRLTKGDRVLAEVLKAFWDDFNDPKVFAQGKDGLALITGPLSETDTHNVRWLLNQARATKNVSEFLRKVRQAKYAPSKSGEKLDAFRHHLQIANDNRALTYDQLYTFLRHFHWLGYDLGDQTGVVLSLMHSHISQFDQERPSMLWSHVVSFVQSRNKDGGTITWENLPDDLKGAFRRTAVSYQPASLMVVIPVSETASAIQGAEAQLALVNLVGAWQEQNPSDNLVLETLTATDVVSLMTTLRDVLQRPAAPLTLHNGLWTVIGRPELVQILGTRIFDPHLDALKKTVASVLMEVDPAFDMDASDRFAAPLKGKVLTHSSALRKAMAETLVLLATHIPALSRCSLEKVDSVVVGVVHDILAEADWKLWGSLNGLLPTLAEAAPEEFLKRVEHTLRLQPCPFDELFSQEGTGITGGNYLTGLLWALEALAWEEKHLVHVCLLLSELAMHDPGGTWANRPSNSLSTILLPWLPQTRASSDKRLVAVRAVCADWPAVGWPLLINLLPNQHRMSSGSHRPRWRATVPDDFKPSVSTDQYWREVSVYADMALGIASADPTRLEELVGHFSDLPPSAMDALLVLLSSEEIRSRADADRLPLWQKLTTLALKHRRFSSAGWAMSEARVSAIENVADALAPTDLALLYRPLFSTRDSDLYEKNGDWNEQRQRLDERRAEAVRILRNSQGFEAVIHFANAVEAPAQVGRALAVLNDSAVDQAVLPTYLDGSAVGFVRGYVLARHDTSGRAWVDSLHAGDWGTQEQLAFLLALPFGDDAWELATQWLGESEGDYWRKASVLFYPTPVDFYHAVDNLVAFGRPREAIDYLAIMRKPNERIDAARTLAVLDAAVLSAEPASSMDAYQAVELIKSLQQSDEIVADDLLRIEWAYLPLLDKHSGASPKTLYTVLGTDPKFFLGLIRKVYKSTLPGTEDREANENDKAQAINAWHLLEQWNLPPGTRPDGTFDGAAFGEWLAEVIRLTTESGHLDVALRNIGAVLIHAPADPSGLWINRTVAEALNGRDADAMRRGFLSELFNARGVHWVDPSGGAELGLARQLRDKADSVENAGFAHLAIALGDMASDYERDAARTIDQHKPTL